MTDEKLEEKIKKEDPVYHAVLEVVKWLVLIVAVCGVLYVLGSWGGGETGADKLNALFMRLTVLLGAIVLFVGWNIVRKIKYQKEVVGRVFCEFITKEGNGYCKLFPIEASGMVEIKANKKRKSRVFALDDLGTYNMPYPPGKWAFLQSQVKKVVLYEDSFEPLSNRRGIITLSPMRLANLINEKFTALGVAFSQDEAEARGVKGKAASPATMLYIILAIIGVAICGLAYFVITKWQAISASLGVQ